jgi:hypothetical protein
MIISFLVALLSTLTILFFSRLSYSNYVKRESNKYFDDRDSIDKIEDPFDLYSENSDEVEGKSLSEKEERDIIKEEKRKVSLFKNRKEIFKSFSAYISLFRILSYIFLIVGFIYLKESHQLEILPYLSGVTVAIISVSLILSFKLRKEREPES